jgi:hypothetical protein
VDTLKIFRPLLILFLLILFLATLATTLVRADSKTVSLGSPTYNGLNMSLNGCALPGDQVSFISWNWGDGSSTLGWFPESHTYNSNGNYTVTVTATYSDGNTASATALVTVASNGGELLITATPSPTIAPTLTPTLTATATPKTFVTVTPIPTAVSTLANTQNIVILAIVLVTLPSLTLLFFKRKNKKETETSTPKQNKWWHYLISIIIISLLLVLVESVLWEPRYFGQFDVGNAFGCFIVSLIPGAFITWTLQAAFRHKKLTIGILTSTLGITSALWFGAGYWGGWTTFFEVWIVLSLFASVACMQFMKTKNNEERRQTALGSYNSGSYDPHRDDPSWEYGREQSERLGAEQRGIDEKRMEDMRERQDWERESQREN